MCAIWRKVGRLLAGWILSICSRNADVISRIGATPREASCLLYLSLFNIG